MTSILSSLKTLRERWNSIDEAWRFAISVFLAVRLFYILWSWVLLNVQPLAVQNIEISGGSIVTVFDLQTSQASIYLREVEGTTLTFRPAGPDTLVDQETGSLWNVGNGQSFAGEYQQSSLQPSKTKPSEIFPYHRATTYPVPWLAIWQRFDANWYLSVAQHGYGSVPGDDHFPPLFPLLIRILTPLFGSGFLAGLFISHAATLYAIKLLYETFSAWGPDSVAKRSTLLALIYPTSFFLFSVYTESFFLVAALLALQAMRERSWAWTGFWTFCAILTRLQGAALVVPMLYLMWKNQPFLRRAAHWFGLALPGFGLLFYLFLRSLQITEGAIPFVEPDWHARIVPPWQTYGYAVQTLLSGNFTFIDLLNWAVITLFLALLVIHWRRLPLEYNLYTAFSLLIILIRIVETQPLISMSRYALTLFPCFYALGVAGENPLLRRLILYTFIPLNLYLSAQFFSWGWVA